MSIKGERMNGKEWMADVGFGAVTGVFTGGAGAIGESVATNVVKTGAKIGIRVGAGVVAGVGSKAITEVKEIATADKKFEDFGKTLDSKGEVNMTATAVSWISSGVVGAVGVVSSQVSSNLSQSASSEVEKCLTRVLVSGATAGGCDALVQTTNIATGVQDEFSVKQVLTSATVSSVVTLGQESVKQGIYAANGGEDKFHNQKANEEKIKKDVKKADWKNAEAGLNSLENIDSKTLNEQKSISEFRNRVGSQGDRRTKATKKIDKKIQQNTKTKVKLVENLKAAKGEPLKTLEIKNDIKKIQTENERLQASKTKVNNFVDTFEKENKLIKMGTHNAHFLGKN